MQPRVYIQGICIALQLHTAGQCSLEDRHVDNFSRDGGQALKGFSGTPKMEERYVVSIFFYLSPSDHIVKILACTTL